MTAQYDDLYIYITSRLTYDGERDSTAGVGTPPETARVQRETHTQGKAKRDIPSGRTIHDAGGTT